MSHEDDADEQRAAADAAVSYALAQLAKGKKSKAWQQGWRDIVRGMLDGRLTVGSRTPLRGYPAWVTMQVQKGGFATTTPLASGPLESFERELCTRLDLPGGDRSALNLHFAGADGRAELLTMLRDGAYEVDVPEAAALLVVALLHEVGRSREAFEIVKTIAPFMDQLRFYPRPAAARHDAAAGGVEHTKVSLHSVGDARWALGKRGTKPAVEVQRTALSVWRPLTDRAVVLVLGLCEHPAATSLPKDWMALARAWQVDYRAAVARQPKRGKHLDRDATISRMRLALEHALQHGSLGDRERTALAHVLDGYVARWGAPGSDRWLNRRAEQAAVAARPSHAALRTVVLERLSRLPEEVGSPHVRDALAPLTREEASTLGAPEGFPLPASIHRKALVALEAAPRELVSLGVVGSGEVLAQLAPELTAAARGFGLRDVRAITLYRRLYTAFRRRRSLLLLSYAKQVGLQELPWVTPIWPAANDEAHVASQAVLREMASLALEAFPHVVVPNRLVRELRALAATCHITLPLVDELAVDIFMGDLSVSFLNSARLAAHVLEGSLYERYYGISYAEVLAVPFPLVKPSNVKQTTLVPGLTALCQALVCTPAGTKYTVRNGMLLEQVQVVTTHNLAPLVHGLGIAEELPLAQMARDTFTFVTRSVVRTRRQPGHGLHGTKNAAYAFRQLVFYLSLLSHDELTAFLARAEEPLARMQRTDPASHQAFLPAWVGLVSVVRGARFEADGTLRSATGLTGRRFLGWSFGSHWLMARLDAEAR